MKFNKIFTLAVAAVMLAAFSATAMAGHGRPRHGHKGGPMGFLKDLNLTDTQKEQAKTIKDKYRPTMEQYREQMTTLRTTMFTAIHAATFSETAVREAAKSIAAVKEEMAVIRAKINFETRSILTEEQITTLDAKLAEMLERIAKCPKNDGPPPAEDDI